jgi:signal transduction histidine kinase
MAGNKNSGKRAEKQFFDALNRVLKDGKDSTARLRRIVGNLVSAAEDGEQWAIKEVADRLDGKPGQTTDVTVHENRSMAEITRQELAVILGVEGAGSGGTSSEDGRGGKPDSVH